MQFATAFVAELPRGLVVPRAGGADRVVLAAEPRAVLPGVRGRLELLDLQELVAESAIKRPRISVLPETAGSDRDRLGPRLGSQRASASPTNSLPLSLRIRSGAPRRPIARPGTLRTPAPLR